MNRDRIQINNCLMDRGLKNKLLLLKTTKEYRTYLYEVLFDSNEGLIIDPNLQKKKTNWLLIIRKVSMKELRI